MVENILENKTAETQIYQNPIAVRFFENLETLSKEVYDGKVDFYLLEPILGELPDLSTISNLHSFSIACNDLTQYTNRASDIFSKLLTYAKHNKKRA